MDVIESIEKNVGKLWYTLNSEGKATEQKIIKDIKIKNNIFYGAVGWLARENKIRQENNYYILGETNLTQKIGKNAGKVWLVLDTWGEVDITSITKLARINEKDVFFAIGWLAREGKIATANDNNNQNQFKFLLK